MRASLVGYLVAGVLAGLVAGGFDASTSTTDLSGGDQGLLFVGTIASLSMLASLPAWLFGLVSPLVPDELGPLALLGSSRRRLFPQGDDPLHERSFLTAALLTLWAFVGLLSTLLARVAELTLLRVQSPLLSALLLTLAAVILLALGLLVATPLHAAFGRALERFTLRIPRAAPLSHPGLWAVLGLLYAALRLVVWRRENDETWDALDLRPFGGFALILGVICVVGPILRLFFLHRGGMALLLPVVLFPFGALFALNLSLKSDPALHAMTTATGASRLTLKLMRLPFDRDGDGFSAVLGGRDCRDDDPAISPGAVEIVGNGLDEDCDGEDLLELSRKEDGEASGAPNAVRSSQRHNIVLLTVDSLRADHLGFLGYTRPTSPAMDALAAESVVFERAWATSSKTPTSVPSLLTGKYPSELIRDGEHFTTYGSENLFLAEALHLRDYRTSGFPSHWYFERKYGLGQGFETWRPFFTAERDMEKVEAAEPVVSAALRHLDNVLTPDPHAPYFLWLHLLDPHKNYLAHAGLPTFGDKPRLPMDKYDGEIRYVDEWVGRLLSALRERPDWNRTVFVLTSDHGEAFGEHGYSFHGHGLHEHQLRVPLVIRLPGAPPRRVATPVSLIDLMPTLLELSGQTDWSSLELRGRSLLTALTGGDLDARPIFAETPKGPHNPQREAYIEWPHKILHEGEGDLYLLYDLQTDARERDDRYRHDPEPALRMRDALKRFRSEEIAVRGPKATISSRAE